MIISKEELNELMSLRDWKNFSDSMGIEYNAFFENRELRATQPQIVAYYLWQCIWGNSKILGIAFKYQQHCVQFLDSFYSAYDSLRGVLGQYKPHLERRLKTRAEFENRCCIHTMSDPCHGRGMSMNMVAVWDGLDDKKFRESLWPCIVWSKDAKWISFS